MNIHDLLARLTRDGTPPQVGGSLTLDPAFLTSLAGELDTDAARNEVWPYFPDGELRLGSLHAALTPADDGWLSFAGAGESAPFLGLAVRLRLGVRPADAAEPAALALTLTAHAADTDLWSLAAGFPVFARSPLAALTLRAPESPDAPLLQLSSHALVDPALPPGMTLAARLDLAALTGENHALFLALRPPGRDHLPVTGTVAAFAPADPSQFPAVTLPSLHIAGLLAAPPGQIGGLLSLANLGLAVSAGPTLDPYTGEWRLESSLTWYADLAFSALTRSFHVPIGVTVRDERGRMLVWSRIDRPFPATLGDLSALVPGTPLALPTGDLSISEAVDLTRLELMLDTGPDAATLVEWISLEVETAVHWVLIENLLELQAIDLRFLVTRPARPERSLTVSLTGLVAIGETGTLALTTSFTADAGATDYQFHGELVNDANSGGPGPDGSGLEIAEVLRHFLGHDDHPDLPRLWVRDFYFTLTPRTRDFSGLLKLHGEWPLADGGKFVLEDLGFALRRSGDADTAFQAHGAFRLGQVAVFATADYVSGGRGWTFTGGTVDDAAIPIGTLVGDVAEMLGATREAVPAMLTSMRLRDLAFRFDTATGDFSLRGTDTFAIDGDPHSEHPAALTVEVALQHAPPAEGAGLDAPPGPRTTSFRGTLTLLGRSFAAAFDHSDGADLLVASYASPGQVELRDLVAQLSTATASLVPPGLGVALERTQLAFASREGATNRFLFGVELGAGVQLAKLPLVGAAFDPGQTLALLLAITVASDDFTQPEVARINDRSAPGTTRFPDAAITTSQQKVQLRVALRVGGTSLPVSAPLAWQSTDDPAQRITPAPARAQAAVQWFAVQQAFGPFHFERVGVGLTADHQALTLLLDASLQLAGLTLTLMGLGAECRLSELSQGRLDPHFHLDGLGVALTHGDDLEISGALLARPVPGHPEQHAFDGGVTVRYGEVAISGLGSYVDIAGHPSLFIYAAIDAPIGGPACFSVTGLALGFGYNRSLKLPPIEQIATFPLVALVRKPDPQLTPAALAGQLADHITAEDGQYFVAAGVRFDSFKLIDGFVLLAVAFGQRFELDLLGLATLTSPAHAPAGAPLLMKAELGLRARYQPDAGLLAVEGRLLPDAYLFSRDCHLTGGFAFRSWFATGDFVLSLGGYHPSFRVPAHYPQVPRLGLSWQVNANLSLKADAYFALTPAAFMAGGHLRANWLSGDLHAWFNCGIDCLVAWQPYHYEAEAEISIGASYHTWYHTFTVDLTAHLQIWGPSFSGKAHVKWWLFSFDIEFGHARPGKAKPLELWSDFARACLPAPADLLTITAESGKATQHGKTAPGRGNPREHLGLLNPRELAITVRSAIPIKSGTVLGDAIDDHRADIGVAPMARSDRDWSSELTLTITRAGVPVHAHFTAEPREQALPVALWGGSSQPDPHRPALVSALTHFSIRPRPIAPAAALAPTTNRSTTELAVPAPLPAARIRPADAGTVSDRERVRSGVQRPAVRQARSALLRDLLPDLACDWGGPTVDAWRDLPRLIQT